MRNYKKYRSFILTLFADFLANKINENALMQGLFAVERDLQGNIMRTFKSLWFKFYKDDTLVTDLDDIQSDWNWSKDKMQIAIDNPKGFQIYYS
ncbi:MAG TPA: hypothetical protein VLA48_02810 [Nitrososphaeraceae archaeon]|nr:hypothetical protein [Nitrososphaeraceae archaeon]